MAKTKFFRVATEGATTDGRVIDGQWIKDIVATYNATTFAARVNCEHINGLTPGGPFGAYGNVLSVKAEPVQLSIGGKVESRLALYAEIEALDPLVALSQAGQKLYTSIEVNPKFAGTDKAYLMGIAITDNPASLGTEMLKFCAGQGAANPLAHRKASPDTLFTAAEETTIEFAGQGGPAAITPPATIPADPFDWLRNLFRSSKGETITPPENQPAAVTTPPAPQAANFMADPAVAAAFGSVIADRDARQAELAALTARLDASEAAATELRGRLESASPYGFTHRPDATGADTAERADC